MLPPGRRLLRRQQCQGEKESRAAAGEGEPSRTSGCTDRTESGSDSQCWRIETPKARGESGSVNASESESASAAAGVVRGVMSSAEG